jgi:branched-chain amino acid transport system permease protein
MNAPDMNQAPMLERVRSLLPWIPAGFLLAIMTGPQGRVGQPGYSFTQAMHSAHLFGSIGFALAAGLVVQAWSLRPAQFREAVHQVRTGTSAFYARKEVRYAFYAALLGFAILLPHIVGAYWQQILVDKIGIYALLAVGLNVVVGFAGLLDLGYIAFYAIGAYVAAYFTGALPVQPPFVLNEFYVLFFAVAAAMLSGLILGAPTLRLRGDYLAIVTLGFGELITILAVNLDGVTNGSRGAPGISSFSFHALGIDYDWGLKQEPYYYLLLAFAVIIMLAFRQLENSRVGRAWTAIREDEVAAQACGIPPVKYKLLAFMIGASTSGFAGVLYAAKISFINPSSFTVLFSILVLVLVIFGGMGSLIGPIAGAAAIQWFFAYVQKHDGAPIPGTGAKIPIRPEDIYLYVGALLIIMMIFRPQGIIPSKRRAREIGMAESGIGGADATGAPGGSPVS